MLAPQRIAGDNGLRAYREPLAIYPQMAFQFGLSILYACGIPEAGNVLSWGLGAALIALVIGTVGELTGEPQAGWLFGGMAVVGLYTAVWHVTSGAHAWGDLALLIAACLCLLPERSIAWVSADRRLALVSVAVCAAASSKISLLPVCTAIGLLAAWRAARDLGWLQAIGIPLGIWSVLYLPLLIWSGMQTGSPFGLATASLFHSRFFTADSIAQLADAREQGNVGWGAALQTFAMSVSAGLILAAGVVAAGARKRVNFRILLGLVGGQFLLIAMLLPHEFRFLGGLPFAVLILAAWELSTRPGGRHWLQRSGLLAIPLCLPWLGAQAYYARPFVAVDIGLQSREAFLEQYVAFTADFRRLDRILPPDAVLYVTNSRLPSYYAPRPVFFTVEDLPPGRPVYRFTVRPSVMRDPMACSEVVYENQQAAAGVYRTPGKPPRREELRVERCGTR